MQKAITSPAASERRNMSFKGSSGRIEKHGQARAELRRDQARWRAGIKVEKSNKRCHETPTVDRQFVIPAFDSAPLSYR